VKSSVSEITQISRLLPSVKVAQLLSYARALAAQARTAHRKARKKNGQTEWERIISHPHPRPKLEAIRARLEKLEREGKIEDFQFHKL